MMRFAKAQVASFLASVADYGTTIFCVELLGMWYVLATVIGTVLGGLTNFWISRVWVFSKREEGHGQQLFRYFLVWAGYLALATSGIWLVTHYLNVNYVASKVMVTFLLAVG